MARRSGAVLHPYPACGQLGTQRLRRHTRRRDPAIAPSSRSRERTNLMTDTNADLLAGQTWLELLSRRSFIELDALGRATALLDPGSLRVLAGPFDRLQSPGVGPPSNHPPGR